MSSEAAKAWTRQRYLGLITEVPFSRSTEYGSIQFMTKCLHKMVEEAFDAGRASAPVPVACSHVWQYWYNSGVLSRICQKCCQKEARQLDVVARYADLIKLWEVVAND